MEDFDHTGGPATGLSRPAPDGTFHPGPDVKTHIILTGSGRWGERHLDRMAVAPRPVHPAYTVTRAGLVLEHYHPSGHAETTGKPALDRCCITVSLSNMGWLHYDYHTDRYANWTGRETCDREDICEQDWRGYRYWEAYPPAQVTAAAALCRHLCRTFGIEPLALNHNTLLPKPPKSGVFYMASLSQVRTDPSPAFPFRNFSLALAG